MRKTVIVLAASMFMLSACGGGDGGSAETPAPSPEGLYAGSTSNGRTFSLLVLDGGVAWASYANIATGSVAEAGLISITEAKFDGAKYASQNLRDASMAGLYSGSVSASYSAGKSISGAISYSNGAVVSFNGAATAAGSAYNYATPASIADIQGTWNVPMINGVVGTMTVAATGAVTGYHNSGCALSGYVVPRPSGKNVFDVKLTLSGVSCPVKELKTSGNAVAIKTPDGKSSLIAMMANADRSSITALAATR